MAQPNKSAEDLTDILDRTTMIALLFDTSADVGQEGVRQMSEGYAYMVNQLLSIPEIENDGQILVGSFGDKLNINVDWTFLRNAPKTLNLKSGGRAHIGAAVNGMLDRILDHRAALRRCRRYRPIFIIVTSARERNMDDYLPAAKRTSRLQGNGQRKAIIDVSVASVNNGNSEAAAQFGPDFKDKDGINRKKVARFNLKNFREYLDHVLCHPLRDKFYNP